MNKKIFVATINWAKTNKERKIHKGSWIGGIFVGLFVGFQGEVY